MAELTTAEYSAWAEKQSWFSTRQAAEHFGVSNTTIYRLTSSMRRAHRYTVQVRRRQASASLTVVEYRIRTGAASPPTDVPANKWAATFGLLNKKSAQ